jgi:mono/diheme cytochrome c family protein
MLRLLHVPALMFVAVAGLMSLSASAQTTEEIMAAIKQDAQADTPTFQGFSPARGEQFFKQKHGNELSCSSCHTDNPASMGKHAKTGKAIKPMAPAANAERFTDPKKVAKWFKRNCNDVLDRVCTPQEKGDVLAYLLTVKN